MAFDDDDHEFDWAAAVAEIDRACSRAGAALENGGAEPSNTQSRAYHQKTLDSFVRGGPNRGRSQLPQGSAVDQRPWQSGTSIVRDPKRCQRPKELETRAHQAGACTEDAFDRKSQLPLDHEAAKVWIYPANVPLRTYQFNIAKSALFCNTLVCLPTGLGKTLIAAVVMYNYFRWFPTGKIVFTAPSRPLVVQQIEACHMVTGIPQRMTIDMTGQMNPLLRAEHWQCKRVFFVTPQVLERDIQAGRCATKQIVCLVVDEAHRSTGNYSYCTVVRELWAAQVEPRILALTATPGSKQDTIQAVVDNLKISCLEYRDENDPDVSQYTHGRKIDLIEVAMNAESIQVKDIFIEVLQPVVQRLCYLGVFYNREISKLTPFEFVAAREKFRQSPPPALQQSRYPEIENYFGIAITLFHVFKLLITHGMRPAFEMLQQKLQQGVLKRLAKNEKLCQAQDLMKQSIGHGAPSPKLEKVADIVSDHFSMHGATNTRVIIFTNFRESVKDIMEKLANACTCVKATEFIGQSSGISSKGQSQKTQQAVLQEFRRGYYNTIVATSIAEEGLDIMEVDLVVCFDANISPIRMIQRMGRTGRKRNGRVVVLASEGAEIQGYLRKQSKNKVLSKHMLNGGVQSFDFHPSDHKIPHSLQTNVQFVELSIDAFVPRNRKLREKDVEPADGVHRKLTEKELGVLKLVKNLPDVRPGISSKAAEPENRFFTGPVHQIRHSSRCCTLMDILQTLQVPVHQTGGYQASVEKLTVTPVEGVDVAVPSSNTLAGDDVCVPTLSPHVQAYLDDCGSSLDQLNRVATTCILPPLLPKPAEQGVDRTDRKHCPAKAENALTSVLREDDNGNSDRLENAPEASRHFHISIGPKISGDGRGTFTAECRRKDSYFQSSDGQDSDYLSVPDEIHEAGPNRCRFSSGVVCVTQSGLVLIASPPHVLLDKELPSEGLVELTGQRDNMSRVGAKLVGRTRLSGETGNCALHVGPCHDAALSLCQVCGHDPNSTSIEPVSSGNDLRDSPVLAAQEDGTAQRGDIRYAGLNPSLADIPKEVVPSTSMMANQADGRKDCFQLPCDSRTEIPALSADDDGLCWRGHKRSNSYKEDLSILGNDSLDPTKAPIEQRTPKFVRIGLNESKREEPAHVDRCVPETAARRNSAGPCETLEMSASRLSQTTVSLEDGAGKWKDDEEMNGGCIVGSAQRPHKLKRLCRAWEKEHALKPEMKFWKHPTKNEAGTELQKSRGRAKRKLIASAFIEEAEVSQREGDCESSLSEDSEDLDDELSGSFIDTASTQCLNGSSDMMNIYRKSLLTPSPQNLGCQQMTMQSAPLSNSTFCSSDDSPAGVSWDNTTGMNHSASAIPLSSVVHTEILDLRKLHKSPATLDKTPNGLDPVAPAAMVEMGRDQKKLDFRKRKLSFRSSPYLEEEPFEGVDLDALETIATAISRLQSQSRMPSNCLQADGLQRGKAPKSLALNSGALLGCSIRQDSRNDERRFVPSFDLGLGM